MKNLIYKLGLLSGLIWGAPMQAEHHISSGNTTTELEAQTDALCKIFASMSSDNTAATVLLEHKIVSEEYDSTLRGTKNDGFSRLARLMINLNFHHEILNLMKVDVETAVIPRTASNASSSQIRLISENIEGLGNAQAFTQIKSIFIEEFWRQVRRLNKNDQHQTCRVRQMIFSVTDGIQDAVRSLLWSQGRARQQIRQHIKSIETSSETDYLESYKYGLRLQQLVGYKVLRWANKMVEIEERTVKFLKISLQTEAVAIAILNFVEQIVITGGEDSDPLFIDLQIDLINQDSGCLIVLKGPNI